MLERNSSGTVCTANGSIAFVSPEITTDTVHAGGQVSLCHRETIFYLILYHLAHSRIRLATHDSRKSATVLALTCVAKMRQRFVYFFIGEQKVNCQFCRNSKAANRPPPLCGLVQYILRNRFGKRARGGVHPSCRFWFKLCNIDLFSKLQSRLQFCTHMLVLILIYADTATQAFQARKHNFCFLRRQGVEVHM